MKTPLLFLLVLAGLSGLQNTAHASTADAEEFLKKSVGDVVAIAKNTAGSEALASRLRPVLLKTICFDTMTRRAVGPGWRQFDPRQQDEAIRLFTALIIRTYSGKFTPGELPDITYKPATAPAPGRVEVMTTTLYQGSRYEVAYRLEEQGDRGWRITDVVIEGVSMVANYRSQFDACFKAGGADAVLAALTKSDASLRK
jgi:phospholipid transport system substrate-binding protein